jgi:hypothetical protein
MQKLSNDTEHVQIASPEDEISVGEVFAQQGGFDEILKKVPTSNSRVP